MLQLRELISGIYAPHLLHLSLFTLQRIISPLRGQLDIPTGHNSERIFFLKGYYSEVSYLERSLFQIFSSRRVIIPNSEESLFRIFADRAFSCFAPRKWNQPPPQIRNGNSFGILKRLLKSHLLTCLRTAVVFLFIVLKRLSTNSLV